MELKAFMPGMILDELADAVGGYENVSMEMSDRATYGVDYFWVGRMWQDRGEVPPMPDWIVRYRRSFQDHEDRQLLQDPRAHLGRRLRLSGWRSAHVWRHPDGHEAHEQAHRDR